jgi:chromosomal replication initiation ATPase DnaA
VSVSREKSMKARGHDQHQIPLELPVEPRLGADDFLVAPSNQTAWELLDSWPHWPAPLILLTGPAGSGKSHLGSIWVQKSAAPVRKLAQLAMDELPALAAARAVLLEDAEPGCVPERALFHLINSMREAGGHILLTARQGLSALKITTPDLLSRLRLAPVAHISSPDDALVRAVLVKLFADRQLLVEANVVEYLAVRIERSLGAARSIVEQLDRQALSSQRAVTRPMAAQVLARLELEQAARDSEMEPVAGSGNSGTSL